MPGLVKRRFEAAEGLLYDASRDIVYLRGGYKGVGTIVGVRSALMDSDVVHLNDIFVKDEVVVRGGSIIKGNILAEGRVLVEAKGSPTIIAGDVGVLSSDGGGEFAVRDGQPLIVLGNILARSVEVLSPIIVFGNVAALERAVIKAKSLILGRTIVGSEKSTGYLETEYSSLYHSYAMGDVNIGRGVTVFVPLIAAKNGTIKMADQVRVMSFACIFCSEVDEPLLCEYYLEDRCPLVDKGAGYDYLSSFDLAKAGDYEYLSWFWRASPLMVLQNIFAKKLLLLAWQIAHPVSVDIEKKLVNDMALEELPKALCKSIIRKLRGEARGALEEVKSVLFSTIEEYFKARGEKYRKCVKCGMPNHESERVCVYCGSFVE